MDRFGFGGAYNAVKRFAAKLRRREPQQFDRLSFLPGEEMQVDYGEGAPTRVPGTDRYRKPRLFVATLRYSRRSFRRVVWKSSQEIWARLHEQAWRYFGGSCRYVVLDNLKEGVLKPDLYEPELNPVYAATLAHYGVVGDPARVRDPNRKGSVENAIGHTQATALKSRRFESIDEQNDFLEHWESRWAAKRIHGSARRQVQAMFEEERPHLQPLPLLSMQYFTEGPRTVCDDSCVRVDHSSYAARPAPIGSKVLVRLFEHRIEIRDLKTHALLRTHGRVDRPGTVVLPPEERVFNPSRETRRMGIRNLAEITQLSYLQQVSLYAGHFHRSPEQLGPEEVRAYQVHLTTTRKLAPSSVSIATSALRFLYKVTLKREWAPDDIPMPRKLFKLPVVLSPEEVMHFLGCVDSLKQRTILTTAYAAGLRVSEATHLKVLAQNNAKYPGRTCGST